MAHAARLTRGDYVLSLACGAGEELRRWTTHFGAAEVLGVERDARRAQLARVSSASNIRVVTASAWDCVATPGTFDVVLCLDAAYHLSPRADFLSAAHAALKPGGRLAFTDLVLADASPPSTALRLGAVLCGVQAGDLCSVEGQQKRLRDAAFERGACTRLDDAVLGGFARFVAHQRRLLGRTVWHPAWWRPAITARLIAPMRAGGLGYALFSASKGATGRAASSGSGVAGAGTGPM